MARSEARGQDARESRRWPGNPCRTSPSASSFFTSRTSAEWGHASKVGTTWPRPFPYPNAPWVAAAGVDIPSFLERHRTRVRQMHVKDLRATTRSNFEFRMDPTEVGSGRIDWRLVLNTAIACGVGEFYVEQEPPFSRTPMDAARISYAFLQTLS